MSHMIGTVEIPRKSPAFYSIRRAVRENLDPDLNYVIGVSGGSDSLALAAACAAEGINITAVIINHKLQEVTDQVSVKTKSILEGMGINTIIREITVPEDPRGMEAAARDARYTALFEYGFNLIVGHTKDDQAETMLLGLSRGSGPAAISGMSLVSLAIGGYIYRPMLNECYKKDTVNACEELSLDYWSDPHNEIEDYTRVNVRKNLIPLMNEILGEGIVDRLCDTANEVRLEHSYIEANANGENVYFGNNLIVDVFANLPEVFHNIVASNYLKANGVAVTRAGVEAVQKLVFNYNGQKFLEVAGGRRVHRKGNLITLT